MSRHTSRRDPGMTLIELLVSIIVIGSIVAVLVGDGHGHVPSARRHPRASRRREVGAEPGDLVADRSRLCRRRQRWTQQVTVPLG